MTGGPTNLQDNGGQGKATTRPSDPQAAPQHDPPAAPQHDPQPGPDAKPRDHSLKAVLSRQHPIVHGYIKGAHAALADAGDPTPLGRTRALARYEGNLLLTMSYDSSIGEEAFQAGLQAFVTELPTIQAWIVDGVTAEAGV